MYFYPLPVVSHKSDNVKASLTRQIMNNWTFECILKCSNRIRLIRHLNKSDIFCISLLWEVKSEYSDQSVKTQNTKLGTSKIQFKQISKHLPSRQWSYLSWSFSFTVYSSQGHETSALLILEKVSDRNLINCTNTALQTYVLPAVQQDDPLSSHPACFNSVPLFSLPTCRPLHVAARKGLTVVVQELLGKGASVLAVDENGWLSFTAHFHCSFK